MSFAWAEGDIHFDPATNRSYLFKDGQWVAIGLAEGVEYRARVRTVSATGNTNNPFQAVAGAAASATVTMASLTEAMKWWGGEEMGRGELPAQPSSEVDDHIEAIERIANASELSASETGAILRQLYRHAALNDRDFAWVESEFFRIVTEGDL